MQYDGNGKRQNHLLSGHYRSSIYAENADLMMGTAGREGHQKATRGALKEVRLEIKNMAGS
jgi:hypothetical protein